MEVDNSNDYTPEEIAAVGGGADEESAPAQTPDEIAPPEWNGSEWEFEHNGKKIFPDSRDKAHTWMQLGYNNSHRSQAMNQERETWKKEMAARDERIKSWEHYNQVDDYVKKNPEWWANVQKAFETRDQNQSQAKSDPHIESLKEELRGVSEYVQSLKTKEQQQQIETEDRELETDIEATRKQHPTIDFNAVDDSGKSLELRILNHAQEIGAKSFRVAFRDYCHDHLISASKTDGLQKAAKVSEINTKKGIIGKSSTPQKNLGEMKPYNHRGKSWGQVGDDAVNDLKEMGII